MAHILITAHGSAGDVNPFVAIGLALRARHHRVEFAVPKRWHRLLGAFGFFAHDLPIENATVHLQPIAQGRATSKQQRNSALREWALATVQGLPAQVEAVRKAGARADGIVAHAGSYAPGFAADLLGIPFASVMLTPLGIPSAYVEARPLPHWIPTLARRIWMRRLHRRYQARFGAVIDDAINDWRADNGLEPGADFATTGKLSRQCTVAAVSPSFFAPPPDWPKRVPITGFCLWDSAPDWRMPDELQRFFASGKPVVALSFGTPSGSMAGLDGYYRACIDAIRALGAQALLIGAPADVVAAHADEADVCAASYAPFSRIYPQCATVIHHGGIGTTAQALAAGKPALVLPWAIDGFFNGAQVQRLGAGMSIRRDTITRSNVQHALAALLHNPAYRRSAQALATCIAAEDGPGRLAGCVESMFVKRLVPSAARAHAPHITAKAA